MPEPRHDRSVTRRIGATVAVAGVMALALSGCMGASAPTPTPSASSLAEPIFASDEEALAAAEAAYVDYTETINTIANEENREPERLRNVATGQWAEHVEGLLEDFSQRGLTIQGTTTVDSFRLVEAVQLDGLAEVMFLVCSDVRETRILNSEGSDVTPPERPDRSALLVNAISSSDGARTLLVDEEEPWSGEHC